MKTLLGFTTALILGLGVATAQAADDKKPTTQQQRMADCNKAAGGKQLKGDARKQFMSSCLKGAGASAGTSQQDKMRHCNRQAGEQQLKGEARKQFMSGCLKG